MDKVIFDSLKHTKNLESVGFSRKQAEKQVEMVKDVLLSHLVSKSDFDLAQAKMEARFTNIETQISALDGKIATMDSKWETKFLALDGKITALDNKWETKFDALQDKILIRTTAALVSFVVLMFAILGYMHTILNKLPNP